MPNDPNTVTPSIIQEQFEGLGLILTEDELFLRNPRNPGGNLARIVYLEEDDEWAIGIVEHENLRPTKPDEFKPTFDEAVWDAIFDGYTEPHKIVQ